MTTTFKRLKEVIGAKKLSYKLYGVIISSKAKETTDSFNPV